MQLLATITVVLVSMMLGAQTQDDVSRLAALHEQAAAAQNAGKYEEAERLHRAVVDGASRLPGFPANELARLLSNLASVLNLQNRPSEALPLLRRAQELLAKQPSADPAQYSALHGNFGRAYAKQGDWKAAEREYNESISVLAKAGVSDRMYLFEFDYGLGYVYWKTGRLVEARKRYEAALETVRSISPPSHPVRQQWEQEYRAILNELQK
jgi:tetratricopeptide (TPR) repeat protein